MQILPMSKKIYLSIPYTYNPEESFEVANKCTALLMKLGNVVFSPISHGHAVAPYLAPHEAHSHSFWMKQDLPMIEFCDELVVIYIGENGRKLVEESKGCKEEVHHARKLNKPIRIMKFEHNKLQEHD